MEIREAKLDEVEKIAILMEQVAKLHYEGRPEIFKENSVDLIKNNIIEIFEEHGKTILVAIDKEFGLCGVLIYKIKEVREHTNLKDFVQVL